MMLERRNHALQDNPSIFKGQVADISITRRGSDWYWTVCAIMTVSTLAFLGLAFMRPRSNRIFHYITAGITMVAAVAYFSMGSNLGWTPIAVEFHRSEHIVRGTYREIFYVRYIDWFVTTPLILMDLFLTAGMPWPTILWVVLVDWVMVVSFLVGTLVESQYKWGYFAFGCAALFYILYQLVWEGRRHANALGNDVGRVFLASGSVILITWICYPICWGVSEGGNVIAPDSEAIFYGILDILSKPVFGALLILGHWNIDPARLGLRIRDFDENPAVHGGFTEKKETNGAGGVTNGTNGHTNGHTNGATATAPTETPAETV
ncbi:family A G protein-coupled receptor-like protein [Rhizodiscina lignyota]|uniref:Family A G protein-coupled receptor-like protein n=1 Tax=Rhizodiscina lignyota TaxID=1504668 RepID=A0A9P4IRD0_9PEZI|nr:family A G protein-coupled receptor-like protein [Rhizodiscina lignyota]